MKRQTARKAAKWWADHLRGWAKHDNGDNSPEGGMTFALLAILQIKEKEKHTPEKINAFETELARSIKESNPRCIGVDYHPDHLLSSAAARAGLELGMATLPIKTTMWIDGDKIQIRCGYGADVETL